jgi:hypothetical protein
LFVNNRDRWCPANLLDTDRDRRYRAAAMGIEPSEELKTQGYTVFRGALDADLIGSLRTSLLEFFDTDGYRYAFSGKVKSDVHAFVPSTVLRVFEQTQLMADIKRAIHGNVRFGHEVGTYVNMRSDWHRDLHDVDAFSDPLKSREFAVYKLCLYLQDQIGTTPDDFALAVQPGTHLRADAQAAEKKIFIRAGDAIIFDTRIWHRGQTDRDWPRSRISSVLNRLTSRVPPHLQYAAAKVSRKLLGGRDRLAIFMVFARDNAVSTEYFESFHRLHCGGVCPAEPSEVISAARAFLERVGIRY